MGTGRHRATTPDTSDNPDARVVTMAVRDLARPAALERIHRRRGRAVVLGVAASAVAVVEVAYGPISALDHLGIGDEPPAAEASPAIPDTPSPAPERSPISTGVLDEARVAVSHSAQVSLPKTSGAVVVAPTDPPVGVPVAHPRVEHDSDAIPDTRRAPSPSQADHEDSGPGSPRPTEWSRVGGRSDRHDPRHHSGDTEAPTVPAGDGRGDHESPAPSRHVPDVPTDVVRDAHSDPHRDRSSHDSDHAPRGEVTDDSPHADHDAGHRAASEITSGLTGVTN